MNEWNERAYLTFGRIDDSRVNERGNEGDRNREWRSRSRSKVCRKIRARERASFLAGYRPTWSLSLRNRAASEYGASSSFARSFDRQFSLRDHRISTLWFPAVFCHKIQSCHVNRATSCALDQANLRNRE